MNVTTADSPRDLPAVIEYTLGVSTLATVDAEIERLLRDPCQTVAVEVVGFEYFDEHEVTALSELATRSPRVQVTGLDSFADHLLPSAALIDVRPAAERAVTHLGSVTVVTVSVPGHALNDHEFADALDLAASAGRDIVTVDLRGSSRLTPAQGLIIAEMSGELHRQERTLILVNTTTTVAAQLRKGGLSGVLRMTVDELI